MSKEISEIFTSEYKDAIHELKQKMEIFETALSLINSAAKEMIEVEVHIKDVKDKLNRLEGKIGNLTQTLDKHFKFNESRIQTIEKRLHSIEMKENMIRQVYNALNLKN
ncbi:MAG TPA: hypothetical protein DHW82_12620 [Spirochaetia bacterium]|nr:MAG: hypothetical protein A2Y41_04090 [Spirochaetes bacterium GWB1_36_13]HCL57833.1 hypothetical protein [Spirochaetia bacterium]